MMRDAFESLFWCVGEMMPKGDRQCRWGIVVCVAV